MRLLSLACLIGTATTLTTAPRAPLTRVPRSRRLVAQYGEPLPAGWTAEIDQASGATFYYNAATGATQWELPTAAPQGALPAGWTAEIDQASGATFYYNTQTGATQWDPPEGGGGGQGFGGQQGWHLVPRTLLDGIGQQMKTDYIVPVGGEQVLGRYDMAEEESKFVSREQCWVQVGADGTATLFATGKPPTGWRTGPDVPWTWLQTGQSVTLGHNHKISLDHNNPMDSCFVVQEIGRAGAAGDQYQPYQQQAQYAGYGQQQGGSYY